MYLLRIPKVLRLLLPDAVFEIENSVEPSVYFTFDDGPVPEVTDFVLEQLRIHNAKGTFFMVGENVMRYPGLFQAIKEEGHSYGNHTYNHLKGAETKTNDYFDNVVRADELIHSRLFRPPYGKIRHRQARQLALNNYKLVMWSLLSGDFDTSITPEQCLENILFHIKPGDVIVFHDSLKARTNLTYTLPRALAYCADMGWKMKAITME